MQFLFKIKVFRQKKANFIDKYYYILKIYNILKPCYNSNQSLQKIWKFESRKIAGGYFFEEEEFVKGSF